MLLAMVFSTLVCYASEVEENPEIGIDSVEETAPLEQEKSDLPWVDKILGFLGSEKMSEVVSLISALAMLAIGFFLKKTISAIGAKITSAFSANKASIDSTSQGLITLQENFDTKLNELESRLLKNGVTAEQIERINEALKTIGDMFNTVYQGSSTIPAAVKAQEGMKFNHIVEVLGDKTPRKVSEDEQ